MRLRKNLILYFSLSAYLFTGAVTLAQNSLCSDLFAKSADKTEIITSFKEVYKSMYATERCYLNTWQLIFHSITEHGISMGDAKVLYLLPKENLNGKLGTIRANYDRSDKSDSWLFHVVLEKDGYIYDPDFTSSPAILPIHEYFAKMFTDSKNEIYIREIPAMDYLTQYQKVANDETLKDSSYFQLRATEYETNSQEDYLRKKLQP